MNIKFEKAIIQEIDSIEEVFCDAIIEMDHVGISQWDEIYPNRQVLKEDIEAASMYIGKIGDKIAVVFVLNHESDEQYIKGKWNYPQLSYSVLHRLCVNPKFQNLGIGRMALDKIEQILREQGIETIRLDAFTKNPYALKLYDRAGYSIVGEVNFRKGKFFLMEKLL